MSITQDAPNLPIGQARAERLRREAEAAMAAAANTGNSEVPAPVEAAPRATRKRVPFGTVEQKLAAPPREGYHRHWFNDEPGRLLRAENAGYTKVVDPATGAPISKVVGVARGGGALTAYLMEIPIEWYMEDQKANETEYAQRMAGIRNGRVPGGPTGADGEAVYIPKTGISIQSNRR